MIEAMALKAELKKQEDEIRRILEDEIKDNSCRIIRGQDDAELKVSDIVELQFFQENDLVGKFFSDENDSVNKYYSLEDLRDLQHDAINNLEDIIEKNQLFRNEFQKGGLKDEWTNAVFKKHWKGA